jgi:hypothetical protein
VFLLGCIRRFDRRDDGDAAAVPREIPRGSAVRAAEPIEPTPWIFGTAPMYERLGLDHLCLEGGE